MCGLLMCLGRRGNSSREGIRSRVAAAMMRLAAQLNYRAAAAELKHQGIEVSHTTLHQKVQAWSSYKSVSDYALTGRQ